MKTQTIIIATGIFLSSFAMAQPAKNSGIKKQKREAHKIAFISHHLNLTPEEAQKFWPVYNQYQNEMRELKINFKKKPGEQKAKPEEFSEKETEELMMKEMELAQKKLDLRKQYYSKFKEALPVKKVAKLYKGERMFGKEMREKRRNHPNKPRPPMEGNF